MARHPRLLTWGVWPFRYTGLLHELVQKFSSSTDSVIRVPLTSHVALSVHRALHTSLRLSTSTLLSPAHVKSRCLERKEKTQCATTWSNPPAEVCVGSNRATYIEPDAVGVSRGTSENGG